MGPSRQLGLNWHVRGADVEFWTNQQPIASTDCPRRPTVGSSEDFAAVSYWPTAASPTTIASRSSDSANASA